LMVSARRNPDSFQEGKFCPPPPSPKSNEENTTKHYSMPYKKC
jgi:hypothetical protein